MSDFIKGSGTLSSEKAELFDRLLRKKRIDIPRSQTITRREAQGPCHLSFAQQRLWFLDQLDPGRNLYNIHIAVRISGPLNVAALGQSFEEILRRHEALRTTFSTVDGEPMQVIAQPSSVELPVLDLSALTGANSESELRRLAIEEAQRPFDLALGPLFRATLLKLKGEEHALLVTMHHIVSDGWSLSVFLRELKALYEAFHEGKPSPLAELPIQYADFSVWQREWLQGEVLEKQLAYWRERLGGELPVLELPTDRVRPAVQTFNGAHHPIALPKSLVEQLRQLSQREEATIYMLLLAAFQILLSRYSRQEDIVVGSPIAGRNRAETEGLIGFFVNSLVMRTDLSGNPTFRELLERVREVALDAYAHQDLPFEKLVEELQPERDLSQNPLFQVTFALQNAPGEALKLAGLRLSSFGFETKTTRFDLEVHLWERADGTLSGSFVYNTDLFDPATVARLATHYRRLLESVVADPEEHISKIQLLTEAEQDQILVEWNDTTAEYPVEQTVHQFFEEQVEQTPESIAVAFNEEQLTYRELNQRSNQLAHYLQKLGTGPGVIVGICMERSLEMVVALLGVLKAGGAYLPLDPEYPKERLAYMLHDSGAVVLLTQNRIQEILVEHEHRVIRLDADWNEIANQSEASPVSSHFSPDSPAYVLYTSGSTGKPKGVVVSHRALCNHMLWMQSTFPLTGTDCVLQKTPFSFDASVWEFYAPLLAGARLVMAHPGGHRDGAYLVKTINEQKVTTLQLVPSLLRILLEEREVATCNTLTNVFCGGEALEAELAERFFALLDANLHNLYGPTEATIDSTFWSCIRGQIQRIVPIGRPISNVQIFLLDSQLQPVPIGVSGEIHIGGSGLAIGYLNQPELTAERFISNPFSDDPTARLYKTGDLARYLADGNIEFLGRIDHQVKIRGYRIEMGEIGTVLSEHPAISESVVVAREEESGDKRLVAYVVPRGEIGVTALRSHLAKVLPLYMVPTAFVMLDSLPLTANGKVDRKALPDPDQSRSEMEVSFVAPRTPSEKVLTEIWAEILGLKQVGINDNFFELGGHSLLATRVTSGVREKLQVELPLRTLFEQPTIAGLALIIAQYKAEKVDRTEMAGLLAELQEISDEEAERLLSMETQQVDKIRVDASSSDGF